MAISIVQQNGDIDAWTGSLAGVQAGNSIVVIVYGQRETAGAFPSLVSSLDGAVAPAAKFESAVIGPSTGAELCFGVYLWNSVSSGTHTFSPGTGGIIAEYGSIYIEAASSAPLELEGSNGIDTSGTAHGAALSTAGAALMAAMSVYNSGSGGVTWDANYTQVLDGSRQEGGTRLATTGGANGLSWTSGASIQCANFVAAFREETVADETAPTYGTTPALHDRTATTITVDATATDAASSTVNHYAVAVANGASAPSATQVAAGQNAAGSAALAAGNDLAVANGAEGSITLTGLSPSTDYDVYYVVGDAVPNYTTPVLINVRMRATITAATVNAAGTQITLTATESLSAGAGGSGGFTLNLSGGAVTMTLASGLPGSSPVYNLSRNVVQGETGDLDFTQPGDGLQTTTGSIWVLSFADLAVTNNSTLVQRTVSAGEASDVPGGTITFTLTNFDGAPTAVSLLFGAASADVTSYVSNSTGSGFDLQLGVLGDFLASELLEGIPFGQNVTVRATEAGGNAQTTIQIDAPDTDGPTYWFDTLTEIAPDSVLPAGAQVGDEAFYELTSGGPVEINAFNGSVGQSQTSSYSVEARVWDGSAWSGIEATTFDGTAPFGYSVAIDQAAIDDLNDDAFTFTFAGAEVGATYDYSISSSGGGTPVTGTGTIATATDQIGPIDVTALPDGTLTLSVTLTDEAGNEGNVATDTVEKDAVPAPSGYTVSIDQSGIGGGDLLSFTFSGATVSATYDYSITSSGGAGEVTGSGTIATATDQISGIDVSSLPDGTLTLSVTLTDAGGTGTPATDTVTLDTTAPVGYAVSIDQALIDENNDTALSFTFSGAEVGAGYSYSITSSGGAGEVANTGTISTGTDQITTINVSTLPDGILTLSVTLTDTFGNEGGSVQDTVTKDTVPEDLAVVVALRDIDSGVLKNAVTYTVVHAFDPADRSTVLASAANVTTDGSGNLTLQGAGLTLSETVDLVGWTADGTDRFHATGTVVDLNA